MIKNIRAEVEAEINELESDIVSIGSCLGPYQCDSLGLTILRRELEKRREYLKGLKTDGN